MDNKNYKNDKNDKNDKDNVVKLSDRNTGQASKPEPKLDITFSKSSYLNTVINHASIQTNQIPDGALSVALMCGELQSEHVDDDGNKTITVLPKAVLRMELTFALRLIEMLNQNYGAIEEALQAQQSRNQLNNNSTSPAVH